jgi:hypothetical protein
VKKLFGAIVLGTVVFGAVMVSASALPLAPDTGTIQSSTIMDVSCQDSPVQIGWLTELNGQGENQVTAVVLSNIDAACYGKWADVGVWAGEPPFSGISAVNTWGTLDSDSSTTLNFTTKPLSKNIDNVAVQIKDAP